MDSRIETLLKALLNGETVEDYTPRSRAEAYLKNCILMIGVEGLPDPQSRLDALLYQLAAKMPEMGGGELPIQTKSVTPTTSEQSVTPDVGYKLTKVVVEAVTSAIDENIKAENILKGVSILGVEGTDKGFEVGKTEGAEEYSQEWWDNFLMYANVNSNFLFAGSGWRKKNFNMKNRTIKPKSAISMFLNFMGIQGYTETFDLVEHLKELNTIIDFSKCTEFTQTFNWTFLKRIGVIDCSSATKLSNTFANSSIGIIDKLIVHENLSYTNTFLNASTNTHMIVEGVIGKNGFNIQWMTKLDHESLMSIINALKDYSEDTSGTVWKIIIGDTNLAKLTDTEIQIAENKGWIMQ